MKHYKLSDIVVEINERENDPANSKYERFVGLEHYVSGDVIIRNYGSTEMLGSSMKVFRAGDVLVARRNVYLKRAATVDFDGLTSGDSIVLRAKSELLGKILPFVLNTDDFWDYADKYSDGTMSKRLSPKVLMQYEFNLPDDDQLEYFVELLWAANDAKEAYRELLFRTDDIVKSQFIEMFGNPITNTKGWPTKPLKEVAPEHTPKIPNATNYWWLNLDMIETYSGNIIEKLYASLENIGSSTSTFDNTMVLYSKLRPYLNKVVVPDDYGYATTELVGLKPDQTILNKYFLFNLLRGDDFVAYANGISGGTQMPRMPVKALREFMCILPPMELQEQFVALSRQSDKSKYHDARRAFTSLRGGERCA